MSIRRPYGTRPQKVEFPFPTPNHPNDEDLSLGTPVKRGANERCASGAMERTFLMQSSLKPNFACCVDAGDEPPACHLVPIKPARGIGPRGAAPCGNVP